MSREEAPTCNSKSPGSTMRRMSASYQGKLRNGDRKTNRPLFTRVQLHLVERMELSDGCRNGTYQVPDIQLHDFAARPAAVFFTRTFTLRVSVAESSPETVSIPEYSNRV